MEIDHMNEDENIVITPSVVSFDEYNYNGERVLGINVHTDRLGVFTVPVTTDMAAQLSWALDTWTLLG
ncbi:hypothetical protein I540_1824 [Mycobacteroides abscessus subsp. bolletii 1513]|uniref:Uncharacterized protein n=1 Tax=Mycobacteroides abscessus subsp. bolletii 1513 TaxID=1299321 RepID=X8DU85_9MYCO|nr:hypothetical protein I540_1824 [Mycobacteroides abscessus subsp. bolletii 1513]